VTDSLSAIHHLIDDTAGKPAGEIDHIYRSSNNDLWQLVRTSNGGHLVRHTPNLSSGSAVSETSVEEFLTINGPGPEHEALRLLLKESATA
jgi:hypothetical protein